MALVAIVKARKPLTSRDLADAIGIDYRNNFNKREAKYARKLEGFIVRMKFASDSTGRKVLHWRLADQWKGYTTVQIAKAFLAARRAEVQP